MRRAFRILNALTTPSFRSVCKMEGVDRKTVAAAALLFIAAFSAIAYATVSFGVSVSAPVINVTAEGLPLSVTVPARTVWQKEYTGADEGLKLDGLNNLAENDTLRVRVELLVDKGLSQARNVIVIIDTDVDGDFDTSDTIVTLNRPWAEFEYTITSGDVTAGNKYFGIALIISAGWRSVSGSFTVVGTVVGYTPAA